MTYPPEFDHDPLSTMDSRSRRLARSAYDRIPEPSAFQGALGMIFGFPLLILALLILAALGVL